MNKVSLYLHIPFCESKCYYCDFASYPKKNAFYQDYVDALCLEIEQVGESLQQCIIDTIFIGGGTPSILSVNQLDTIQSWLKKSFSIAKDAEITMEANPGTLDQDKIDVIGNGIINRISMGLQSTENDLLKKIGRIHTFEEFKQNYESLRKVGIKNINIDMMFGLPDQTTKGYINGLSQIAHMKPEHISSYGLIIEEGTPFYGLYHNNQLHLPDEQSERDMYDSCLQMLKDYDYEHYEISNFSKPGYACRHNLVYWDLKPYVGLGLASHSYYKGQRYEHTKDLEVYIQKAKQGQFHKENIFTLTTKEMMEEFMFLGLRKMDGIAIADFEKRFGILIDQVYGKQIDDLLKEGLIQEVKNSLLLTRRGMDLANRVFSKFLIDE
ncbi:radical SAM family heme chaperone HemW [Vallitalea okinawensis]|uniref:radical SAM family heme chaperone HemW n=1 Tax=Vallitalea okinawensis TaxID=2078660 RepID=UPI000CFB9FA4|nr:radical SAM family heme chaperone HemW [Vallitalea okinawensis]